MARYWDGAPPINEMFAAFVGHTRSDLLEANAEEKDPFQALIDDFNGLG